MIPFSTSDLKQSMRSDDQNVILTDEYNNFILIRFDGAYAYTTNDAYQIDDKIYSLEGRDNTFTFDSHLSSMRRFVNSYAVCKHLLGAAAAQLQENT